MVRGKTGRRHAFEVNRKTCQKAAAVLSRPGGVSHALWRRDGETWVKWAVTRNSVGETEVGLGLLEGRDTLNGRQEGRLYLLLRFSSPVALSRSVSLSPSPSPSVPPSLLSSRRPRDRFCMLMGR